MRKALIGIATGFLLGCAGLAQAGEVVIAIEDADDLYAIDISIAFDADLLQVRDSNPQQSGTQLGFGTFLDPGLVVTNEVDNEEGSARKQGGAVVKTGHGDLAGEMGSIAAASY